MAYGLKLKLYPNKYNEIKEMNKFKLFYAEQLHKKNIKIDPMKMKILYEDVDEVYDESGEIKGVKIDVCVTVNIPKNILNMRNHETLLKKGGYTST